MANQPNILILMLDQLTGTLFENGPAAFLHAPNMRTLAEKSVQFSNCYTPSPLCVPARAAIMTGMLPSRTGVYDNAAELPAQIPTFAHYLRRAGYYTALCGKMHFVGPDQLHGFEARLTTDIYPADFGWTPDYGKPGERIDWWYHNLGSVTGAGVAETTNQLEFDDEVAFHSVAELHRLSRRTDPRPWCLTVSFTHPHDPYVARQEYWDLYDNCPALAPKIPALTFAEQDPHGRRLYLANDYEKFSVNPEDVHRARRGYFANISYLDEKIGAVLQALETGRMLDDTIILFSADHGDMLGETGLWFKMSFREGSARVPLMFCGREISAKHVQSPVSGLDILPTILDLAGIGADSVASEIDGESLLPLLEGGNRTSPVLMEYAAEGSYAPMVSLRDRQFKFNHCELDPPQLFDLQQDPIEQRNLAADRRHGDDVARFLELTRQRWDMRAFDAEVRQSQKRRHLVYAALRQGAYRSWDYQPHADAAARFMRNHMDLNDVEASARFPRGTAGEKS